MSTSIHSQATSMTSTVGKARTVSRRLLRHEIRRELLESLLDGRLSAGEHVTESQLADQLGVSRTPLREALFGLEQDGFFSTRNGRGLTVSPLTAAEASQVYPVLAALEGLAIRSSGVYDATILGQLRALSSALARELPFKRAASLDTDWARLVVSPSGNGELLKEIARLQDRTRRYELAFLRDTGRLARDSTSRDAVIGLLEAADNRAAAAACEELRLTTVATLLDWLRPTRA